MPKGKRGKRKPDPVEIRWRLLVRKDLLPTLTSRKYNQIYRDWVETGKLPEGYRVPENATEWRNPTRRDGMANWRTGNNTDAVETLLRRSLPAVEFKLETEPQRKRRFAPEPVPRHRRAGKTAKKRKK